jgi:hypothetical protein
MISRRQSKNRAAVMSETKKSKEVRFRATRDFAKSLDKVWDGLRALPQLKRISDERLQKELYFIWEVGGNYLRHPARPERLRRSLVSGEKAVLALQEFLENFRKLLHSYDLQDFYAAYDAHPLYGQIPDDKLHLPELGSDVMDVMADIGIAVEIFAQMPGITVADGKVALNRKVLTRPLVNIIHIAMKSWLKMTGKEFVFAKGVENPSNNNEEATVAVGQIYRPLQDDAYFACLCIQLVTSIYDPSLTITAINRARKSLNTYRKALADKVPAALAESARIDYLDKLDDRMRRTIYGLEY